MRMQKEIYNFFALFNLTSNKNTNLVQQNLYAFFKYIKTNSPNILEVPKSDIYNKILQYEVADRENKSFIKM